jgi:hypothetical protein
LPPIPLFSFVLYTYAKYVFLLAKFFHLKKLQKRQNWGPDSLLFMHGKLSEVRAKKVNERVLTFDRVGAKKVTGRAQES